MKIVDVEDLHVWGRRRNPEIEELIQEASSWQLGDTKQIELETPYKSLGITLKNAFKGKRSVHVKMIEEDPRRWYVMLDKALRKKGMTQEKGDTPV